MSADDAWPPQVDFDDRVHRVSSFTCGTGGCIVGITEAPERSIAGSLLEEVGDWSRALKSIERERVPPGVIAALDGVHAAVAGWVDWLDRTRTDR